MHAHDEIEWGVTAVDGIDHPLPVYKDDSEHTHHIGFVIEHGVLFLYHGTASAAAPPAAGDPGPAAEGLSLIRIYAPGHWASLATH
ncbi:hypothetical protein [Tsukamurella sp. 1534]|uniref:hypothetical protein n=1 Tax=Tsukamurella sp. 1534 TaxID=1151061 RepID=UPI0002D9F8D0|nr:hypothetical protein [Tsukamurella sp. 1534]